MAVIDTKNVTLKIKDAGSNVITVKLGEGNFTYDEKRTLQYVRDRGVLDTVREGDQEPMDIRLDAEWVEITADSDGDIPSIEDAMKQRGLASDWVSTSADLCEPYCVNIEMTNVPLCAGIKQEVLLFPYFRWESINHDMKAGTLSFTGKCNATQATATRVSPPPPPGP